MTCKHELEHDHADLVPIFDLLYFNDNVIYYQQPDGTWDSFLQQEGYAQGCPLNGLFACKVLHQTLKELHQALDLHASACLLTSDLGDNGLGSKTVLGNFHDDSAIVPHCNFRFVYQEFDHIGTPHGLCTNWDKSGVLVTLDPSDVPTNQDYLDGISLLLPSNSYTHGTTFLGTPLGHPSFIHSRLMEVADEFDK
jgi:hypothetical protein